jgi:uncharacterized membrane protein
VKLTQGRHSVAKKTAGAKAGSLSVSLAVPRSARPGRYSIVVVAHASGQTRQITRKIKLIR